MAQTQQIIVTIFHATLADLQRRMVHEAREFRNLVTTRPRLPLKLLREHGRALVSRQILALSEYELMANLAFNELKGEFRVMPRSIVRKTTRTWLVSSDVLNLLQPRLLRLERGHPVGHRERLAHWQSTCGSFNLGIRTFKKLRACGKNFITCYLAIDRYRENVEATDSDDEFIGLHCMQI